ncbi:flagellar hook-length control protein FliK [Methylorubrum podarium]|uniref:flagellar hook-length control protein FliK n=1 Tax=Methylorubrum podarium TaxID=200476 RepID=UPI001EE26430|nr:flagellar hook-length control protein FliK [Methylorubrum podarium]GJE71035.1 hypothetical protein CHKEEEPN_2577 [Methylorubrum podarium]
MPSLDTLLPLRPKAEAGRAPAGEDPRAGGASGFEAMLGALEGGAAPGGEAAAEPAEAEAETPPALASDAPIPPATDAAGSALQALMALAGPTAAPAPAVHPDAGLEAMVQRAAVRAGSGPSPIPTAPALPMSVVGLETHFAPVRPREGALPTSADGRPSATGALSAPAITASGAPNGFPSIAGGDGQPPSAATALDATAADVPARPLPSDAGVGPLTVPSANSRGGVHDRALAAEEPIPAQGAFNRAAQAPVDRSTVAPAATLTAPGSPETPAAGVAAAAAQPAPVGPGQGGAAVAAATSPDVVPAATPAPAQAAAALGNPAGRGRAAPRGDQSEPAGAAASAPSLTDPSVSGDLAEPAAAMQGRPTEQIRREPEPVREQPAGIARPETAAERAAASAVRATADADRGPTASAGPTAEAPRPDRPLAEPVPHDAASAPAPVPTSPLRQIVDAVATQLPAAASGAQGRPLPAPVEGGPLKILTLQLHPADLGSVLVRMRLQDGRLEMSLRTSREETAERLRKEGDLLSGLLREAGYEPDTVTIQAGGAGPGDSGPRGQGFASFAGSQAGQHDRQPGAATPDHSGRRPSPRADGAATPTEEQDHETDSRGRDRGGLYL